MSTEIFDQARDHFIASLSPQDLKIFTPCPSCDDFLSAVDNLNVISCQKSKRIQRLKTIQTFTNQLRPFFEIINIFVSSNPQYAALFWGAFRLVLQLADNFTTFFDKFTELIQHLSDAFPQYGMILEMCKDGDPSRIRHNVEEVYKDIFHLFHEAVRVFTKADGKIKRTPVVIGELMWKPFDVRFKDHVERMHKHRQLILDELYLWNTKASVSEREFAAVAREKALKEQERTERASAKERQLTQDEHRLLAEECRLLAEERCRMVEERAQKVEESQRIASFLAEIRKEKAVIEQSYLEAAVSKIQSWLSPPKFSDAKETSSELHQDSTTAWIFDDPQFKSWLGRNEQTSTTQTKRKFESNALWIYGNPGSGKTILASFIIDSLKETGDSSPGQNAEVYYFFFKYESQVTRSSDAAYRSILTQILWHSRDDKRTIDRFAFMMGQTGQLTASENELRGLLQLCLTKNSILILDGIDECGDNSSLIKSLLKVSVERAPRILFLSRINVPSLKRSIQADMQMQPAKQLVTQDICLFCDRQLDELIEDDILPDSAHDQKDVLVQHLVKGADGMFLWARLMLQYLRSPSLTPRQRLRTIKEVNFPEGLETMYDRILLVIHEAGATSRSLASKILIYVTHSIIPMTTIQIQHAIIAETAEGSAADIDDITEFEDAAIMTCAGLLEKTLVDPALGFKERSNSFRFVHLSIKEMLTMVADASLLSEDTLQKAQPIIPEFITANLVLARCCLQQMIFHTPAQPLSGNINHGVSAEYLYSNFPFTSYAAIYWMGHLKNVISKDTSIAAAPHNSAAKIFEDAFSGLVSLLSTFLSKPELPTAWLECLFTAIQTLPSSMYQQPAGSILQGWITWALELSSQRKTLKIAHSIGDTAETFSNDLDRILESWGDPLTKLPETVWNEMTGFTPSQFFFSPGGTRVSSRAPERIQVPGLSERYLATITGTSSDGNLQGVLSIWSPKNFGDGHYPKDTRSNAVNLRERCQGWIAMYELWTLEVGSKRIGKVQVALDPKEVVIPVRDLLDGRYGRKLMFPLIISQDALSFVVLRTLFSLKAPTALAEAQCQSQILPIPSLYDPGFIWVRSAPSIQNLYYFKGVFFSTGRFLAFAEQHILDGELRIMVFEISTEPRLSVGLTALHKFKHGIYDIKFMVFHPRVTILAFFAASMDMGELNSGVYLWKFQGSSEPFLEHKLIGEPEDIQFSECGAYFVIRHKQSVIVLPVNDVYLKDPDVNTAKPQKEKVNGDSSTDVSIRNEFSEILGLDPTARYIVRKSFNQGMTSTSTIVSNSSVSLTRQGSSSTETIRLTALPKCKGLNDLEADIKVPRFEGDPVKIILNKAPQTRYSLSTEDRSVAMLIEKDISFVQRPGRLAGKEIGEGTEQSAPDRSSRLGKRDSTEHPLTISNELRKRSKVEGGPEVDLE